MDDGIEERLAAVERQLAELTAQPARPMAVAAGDDTFWALQGLKERAGNAVLFTGAVDLPTGEHADWQLGAMTDDLLAEDWSGPAATLAALGHPVRLLLLRKILEGVRTTADLAAQDGLGTTGQLYHHLRQLVSAGWLRQAARGQFVVPPERIVPLLAIVLGARR